PTPLEVLRENVPKDLERLVMRTLAIAPDLRPPSMEAMARELGLLADAAPSVEQPPLLTDRVPRSNAPYVAAVSALAALGVAAALYYVSRPHGPTVVPAPVVVTSTPAPPVPAPKPTPPTTTVTTTVPVAVAPAPARVEPSPVLTAPSTPSSNKVITVE